MELQLSQSEFTFSVEITKIFNVYCIYIFANIDLLNPSNNNKWMKTNSDHYLNWYCLSVLYAMKEDSEKVPTLLTDYILKGNSNLYSPKL